MCGVRGGVAARSLSSSYSTVSGIKTVVGYREARVSSPGKGYCFSIGVPRAAGK